jgi:hypothetical protein
MAKPIFITYMPEGTRPEDFSGANRYLNSKIGDEYHCLVVPTKKEEVRFEMFNGENLDDITLEELKEALNVNYEKRESKA